MHAVTLLLFPFRELCEEAASEILERLRVGDGEGPHGSSVPARSEGIPKRLDEKERV